jgi:hypothetical protein
MLLRRIAAGSKNMILSELRRLSMSVVWVWMKLFDKDTTCLATVATFSTHPINHASRV